MSQFLSGAPIKSAQADKLQSQAPVQGDTSEQQAKGRGALQKAYPNTLEDLQRLEVDIQELGVNAIAERYGVTHHAVLQYRKRMRKERNEVVAAATAPEEVVIEPAGVQPTPPVTASPSVSDTWRVGAWLERCAALPSPAREAHELWIDYAINTGIDARVFFGLIPGGQTWAEIAAVVGPEIAAEIAEEKAAKRQAQVAKADPKVNPWKADFLQKCTELALLPIGDNKRPIDLETGGGLKDWPNKRFTVEELLKPNECLRALGYRPGPESGNIVAIDLDGAEAVAFFEERGAMLADVGWVTGRNNAPGRNKVHFRLSAEQMAALPAGKSKLTLKQGVSGKPGEQIELFNGAGQCVIAGKHPSGASARYTNTGDPTTVTAPNDAWWTALQEYRVKWATQSARVQKKSSAADEGDLDHVNSSAENPCPICGRTHSGWCSLWVNKATGDEGVNCHHGSNGAALALTTIPATGFLPAQRVAPGTTVPGLDGREWAYIGDGVKNGNDTFSKFVLDRPGKKKGRNKEPKPPIKVETSELEGGEFRVLGWVGSNRKIIAYRRVCTGQIGETQARGSGDLMLLAPDLDHWVKLFGAEREQTKDQERNGIPAERTLPVDWTQAGMAVVRAADAVGAFDPLAVRGHGVWRDGGHTVLHLGDALEVDGVEMALAQFRGEFQYDCLPRLPIDTTVEPLTDAEGLAIYTAIKRIGFESPIDNIHLAGWCVVALASGALQYRPGLVITASTQTGKSTVAEIVVMPLTAGIGIYSSNSSEAGIRQRTGSAALPVVIDESENENPKRREDQLRLMRLSFDGKQCLMGTQDNKGRSFALRSAICAIGINATITNTADRNRIVTITRTHLPAEEWSLLMDDFAELGLQSGERAVGERLLRRLVNNLDMLLNNIKAFGRAVAKRYGGRTGDTYGALLAGAYFLGSLDELDEAGAMEWMEAQKWELDQDRLEASKATSESERCLARLLRHVVSIKDQDEIGQFLTLDGHNNVSLQEVIQAVWKIKTEPVFFEARGQLGAMETALGRLGIKVDEEEGLVLTTSIRGLVEPIYEGTKWSGGAFKERLLDLKGARKLPAHKQMRFKGGTNHKSLIALPMALIRGEAPADVAPEAAPAERAVELALSVEMPPFDFG